MNGPGLERIGGPQLPAQWEGAPVTVASFHRTVDFDGNCRMQCNAALLHRFPSCLRLKRAGLLSAEQ